jgi:hypothetical protein
MNQIYMKCPMTGAYGGAKEQIYESGAVNPVYHTVDDGEYQEARVVTGSTTISQYFMGLLNLALGGGTLCDSLTVAIIVGTILTAINHGDEILEERMPPFWKLFLTYLTPFAVSTFSAVRTKLRQAQRNAST